jgi:hypothetical protein
MAPDAPSPLDQKILEHFAGNVVRKDLTTELKQNAVVPTYVLEYLLGQHCATDDPALISDGLESVRRILAKHYVHRNQAELIQSTIKDKGGFHEVEFTNLGIKKELIDDSYVKRYPKLLVGGIWAITEVEVELPVDPKASPWQIARVDHDAFLAAPAQFSTDEWIDVLMQSVGFNPEPFTRRGKLLTLIRLIPFCERNYNLLELGPKGTGKSHVYAEFSPHGMLISGSEVTAPKLFVSNASGKIGLVGYWDCICFDEFTGKDKKVDKTLVDIMKNYMANRTFSRGIEQLSAEASIDFAYRPIAGGAAVTVLTPEEQQYPALAGLRPLAAALASSAPSAAEEVNTGSPSGDQQPANGPQLKEQHLVVPENTKGWSYRRLFGVYLQGCGSIIIRDPYIRAFHQIRNLVEFLRLVNEITPVGDEVSVHLITGSDQETLEKQMENLGQVKDSFAGTSTPFTWEIDASPNFHARSISTDHGWQITLDRGLDLFQWFEFSPFNAAAVMQEARRVKGCEISFIRTVS